MKNSFALFFALMLSSVLVGQIVHYTPDQTYVDMELYVNCNFKYEDYNSSLPDGSIGLNLDFYAASICPSGFNQPGYLHMHSTAGNIEFVSEVISALDGTGETVEELVVSPLLMGESIGPNSIYTPLPNSTGYVLYTDGVVDFPGDGGDTPPVYYGGVHVWQFAFDRYVGFRIYEPVSEDYLYGWFKLFVSGHGGFGFGVTIDEIALNMTPGAGIQIGQIEGMDEDFNGDGLIDINDFLIINSEWGPCTDCPADLTGDGVVDIADFLIFNSAFGQ